MLLALLALLQGTATDTITVYDGRARALAVAIPRVAAEVTVDGALDEPVWAQAPVLAGFSHFQPIDGEPAEDSTEVRVWYSPTAIHFGVRAREPHGEVHATLADRDRIFADDYMQIMLGTFNDGRQAFMFAVNPLGVQADGVLVERGQVQGNAFGGGGAAGREQADLSPDYVFASKGRLVPGGYEIEIRVPFKSFRYQAAGEQTWQLHLLRRIQHSGYEDSWVPAERASASFLGQAGTLTGLHGLERGLTIDITPEVTGHWDGAPTASGWNYDGQGPEFGGTVRWGITSNLSLNGTVNPDFSQIEADVTQIQFDPRDAVFYPEKRPFFLDGLELFQTPNNLVYTRRIVQPEGAVKLTGKSFGMNVGLISAVDDQIASQSGEDHPIINILRLQKDVGDRSKVGMVYTDRIDGDDYNRVVAGDTRILFGRNSLGLQYGQSWTSEGGQSLSGPVWEGRFNHTGKHVGLRYRFGGVDPDFRSRSGFIRRTGDAEVSLVNQLILQGKPGALVETFTPDVTLNGKWIYDTLMNGGGLRDRQVHFNLNTRLHGGWSLGASLLVETFGYDYRIYANTYVEVPGPGGVGLDTIPFTGGAEDLNNLDWVVSLNTPEFRMFSANVFYLWGKDENFYEWSPADIKYLNAGMQFRPTDQIRLNGTYSLQDFIRHSDGTRVARFRIPRLKLEYQVARPLFIRLVGEYVAYQQDSLRDDTRTEGPLLYGDGSGGYTRAGPVVDNTFQGEALVSFTPTPGTVIFVGYGSTRAEPDAFAFKQLDRVSDGFFVKLSYLFRVGG